MDYGTQYDLSKGLAAGPFGTPNRYSSGEAEKELNGYWERPIDYFRTVYTVIIESSFN